MELGRSELSSLPVTELELLRLRQPKAEKRRCVAGDASDEGARCPCRTFQLYYAGTPGGVSRRIRALQLIELLPYVLADNRDRWVLKQRQQRRGKLSSRVDPDKDSKAWRCDLDEADRILCLTLPKVGPRLGVEAHHDAPVELTSVA